jgi:hypothetical protein
MTDGPSNPLPGAPASLVERAKNILVSPKTEWPRIDAEPGSIQGIYTSYVMILAAIGPICALIGQQVFGFSGFGITFKPSIGYSITFAVLGYVMSLAMTYVLGLVIDALAPNFGGTKDPLKAFKVAAYAMTAAWIGGVLQLLPSLALIGLLFLLYSAYLIYLGLPVLMKAPQDKAVGYAAVVIIVQIVLYFVAAMIVGALVASFFPLGGMLSGGSVQLP